MNIQEVVWIIREDIRRYTGDHSSWYVSVAKFFHNPGMGFSILHRWERYFLFHKWRAFRAIGFFCYPMYFFISYFIFGYHIEPSVEFGPGLFLHNSGIVITDNTKIGPNASIMGQVTIGTDFDVRYAEIRIGKNVRIGTGVRIIANGKLHITDNVTIGANSVVVKSIRRQGTYVGIPAHGI